MNLDTYVQVLAEEAWEHLYGLAEELHAGGS